VNTRRLGSRGFRAALLLAIAIGLSASSAANAGRPEIIRSDTAEPLDVVVPADCFDGTMHITGTERMVSQVVDFGGGNFRYHGTLTDDFDVAFSNGWTGAWTTLEHFSFSTRGDDDAFTNVHRDTTAVYDSNGQRIGTVTFHVVEHHTIVDGIARVEFAHPKLTCDL
jgi:hypothetical protein